MDDSDNQKPNSKIYSLISNETFELATSLPGPYLGSKNLFQNFPTFSVIDSRIRLARN
jgi:hypothetical protein